MGNDIAITLVSDGPRRCGGCTLCCKLLPMRIFNKPAGKRCQHQQTGKGCMIYNNRPGECAMWTCRWLTNADTADLRRPDRARYVIDLMPDFVTVRPNDGSEAHTIEVVQIWCEPNDRNAWRDPALLEYLKRRGQEGIAALIRFNERDAIAVFPPTLAPDGQWHEVTSGMTEHSHTFHEIAEGVGNATRKFVAP